MKFTLDINTIITDKTFKDKNAREELLQRAAWRLVRSAADRMKGPHRGSERLIWCVDRLRSEFQDLGAETAQDYVRAAYSHFETERTPGSA